MKRLTLPEPRLAGKVTVEGALRERRSIRRFASQSLTLDEIGQLLWSVQGVTGTGGERTTPSAGGLYPLQIYLVAARVDGLEVGIYRYRPDKHDLEPVAEGDVRVKLAAASHGVEWVDSAPAVLAIGGSYRKRRSNTARALDAMSIWKSGVPPRMSISRPNPSVSERFWSGPSTTTRSLPSCSCGKLRRPWRSCR